MILVLKDADFSANNIGTIEVPYELSQQTKDLLTHLTKYDEEDSEAIKLDVFLKAFNASTFKNKIKVLCLPAFASNLTQCFYNIIDGGSIAPQTLDVYEMKTYGYGINPNVDITDKNTYDRYSLGVVPAKIGVSGENFEISAGVYDATGLGINTKFFGLAQSPYVTAEVDKVTIGSNSSTTKVVTNADSNQRSSKGLRSISYKGSDLLINYCGLVGTGTTYGADFTPTIHKFDSVDGRVQFCGYTLSAGAYNTGTTAFMFIGTFLSQNELGELNTMVNNLLSFIE